VAPTVISSEFIIVCEGDGDQAFFRHLCAARDIAGFQIEKSGGGNSGFADYFIGLSARSGSERLKGVIVSSDNDTAPDESFKLVRNQLKKAKVPAPDNPLKVLKWGSVEFAVAVMMIPFSDGTSHRGCLETLLLQAARETSPDIYTCAEEYVKCTGADRWQNQGAIDKLRLRCILSAAWSEDPYLGLQYALLPEKGLLPLQHHRFDEIATFIRAFPETAKNASARS
jgi:hypothetical protein